jgi:small GTP-binding protein
MVLTNFKNHNQITMLDLSSTDLENLPKAIGDFNNLKELKLSENKLSKLPKNLKSLTQLERIDLSNNRFTHIPTSINHLTSLKQLNLSSNQVRNIPKWINGSDKPQKIYFPEKIDSLEILNLNNNLLNCIPESIGNLSSLKKLDLGYNSLFKIPSTIGNLENLEFLSIEHNQLTSIPNSIGKLVSLKELKINDNRLTSLHNSIQNLVNLETLSLENNNLSLVPSSIGSLEKLRKVNLLGNSLETLPESLFNLRDLEFISLEFDNIPSFPDSSKRVLKNAIAKGVRIHNVSYNLMPYKIIIIGDRFVGKTSLIKRMCGESFPYTYTLTVGVQVSIYELEIDNLVIPINIWDIGGDPRFRFIIDSFFKHSLGAVIVYDITKPLTERYIKDWIERCKKENPTMPIVLAGNKKDLVDKEKIRHLEKQNIENQFEFLDHVFVSAKHENPLEDVIKKLVNQHTITSTRF